MENFHQFTFKIPIWNLEEGFFMFKVPIWRLKDNLLHYNECKLLIKLHLFRCNFYTIYFLRSDEKGLLKWTVRGQPLRFRLWQSYILRSRPALLYDWRGWGQSPLLPAWPLSPTVHQWWAHPNQHQEERRAVGVFRYLFGQQRQTEKVKICFTSLFID